MPAFLVLAIGSLAGAIAVRNRLHRNDRLRQSAFVRALVFLIAVGFAVGGIAAVVDLAAEPHSGATLAYVLSGMLVAGGLAYATGVAVWSGPTAYELRLMGWLGVSLPLAFSFVFALLFPLAAVLVVALAEIGDRPPRARRYP